jgi:hypothetical protein
MMRATYSTLVFGLALGLATGSPSFLVRDANAVVVCQRGKRVKLRASTCRKKETRVGLDADTLQGLTPEQLTPGPQVTLEALKTVDGAGSGLDADTIQGVPLSRIVGSEESLRILRGSIFGDGSIETGAGFTASKLGTGGSGSTSPSPFRASRWPSIRPSAPDARPSSTGEPRPPWKCSSGIPHWWIPSPSISS